MRRLGVDAWKLQNKGIHDAIFCKIRKFVWLFQKKILPLQQNRNAHYGNVRYDYIKTIIL